MQKRPCRPRLGLARRRATRVASGRTGIVSLVNDVWAAAQSDALSVAVRCHDLRAWMIASRNRQRIMTLLTEPARSAGFETTPLKHRSHDA
jgi:hypothetical protein